MSAPVVVFFLSGITVVLGLVFRNERSVSSLVSAGGMLLCAIFVLLIPIDKPLDVLGSAIKFDPALELLGRALILSEATQPMVGFLYLSGSFLLLPSWLVGESRYFPPLAVAMLTVAAAAIIANPFLYAAIFIEFTAFGGGLILVSRRRPRNLGAIRLLSLYTLGMLIILITGWILDQGSITSSTTEMANRVTLMLLFGIAVLILVPPFHIWLINASEDANPYALSFVVLTLQSAALFFLLRFLDVYPWLRQNEFAFRVLRSGGILCLIVGVIFAISQRDLRKTIAYMIVADIGFSLLAIGTSSSTGYRLALGMTASRIVSLGVLSLALSMLLHSRDPVELVKDHRHADMLPRLVIFVGMLSLSGFPLTAGFPGRWSLLTVLLDSGSLNAYLVLAAFISVSVVTLWWGYNLLRDGFEADWFRVNSGSLFLGLGVITIILLGVFPQLTYPWVVDLVSGLNRLFG